ncbi:MAG: hypothetical protein AAFW98_14865 [Pseudomonadota bacterium]
MDFGDFAERAAILEYDGGLNRHEAEDIAARDAGFDDAAAFRVTLCASWRTQLDAMQGPELPPSGSDYVANAVAFVDGGWAERALEVGWTEAELVGADEVAPWARLDRLGAAYLIPNPAAITITEISQAVRGGDPLVLRRSLRRDGAPPWVSALEISNEVGGD